MTELKNNRFVGQNLDAAEKTTAEFMSKLAPVLDACRKPTITREQLASLLGNLGPGCTARKARLSSDDHETIRFFEFPPRGSAKILERTEPYQPEEIGVE